MNESLVCDELTNVQTKVVTTGSAEGSRSKAGRKDKKPSHDDA